jgi:DNA-directed RNA polymerase specialized sigma24 family protein
VSPQVRSASIVWTWGDPGWQHGMLRFASRLTGGHPASAEDLVQTVLLRLTDRGIGNLADPATYARRCTRAD